MENIHDWIISEEKSMSKAIKIARRNIKESKNVIDAAQCIDRHEKFWDTRLSQLAEAEAEFGYQPTHTQMYANWVNLAEWDMEDLNNRVSKKYSK